MRSLAVFLLISAGAYFAIFALFYLRQDQMLFIGARPVTPPSDPRVERIEHIVGGVSLRGVRVRAQEDEHVVVVYFGGNAEPVVANVWSMLALSSVTAYLVDYRGYGASDGSPSEAGLRGDALARFDWVRDQHPESKIAIVGRSLGTAMALHVAARREVDGLILISPFTSLRDVAAFHYPWLPVRLLMKNPFDTLGDTRRIETGALVIAAENDSVIPGLFTEALIRELPSGSKAHVIPGTDHNDLMTTAEEWALIRDHLRGLP